MIKVRFAFKIPEKPWDEFTIEKDSREEALRDFHIGTQVRLRFEEGNFGFVILNSPGFAGFKAAIKRGSSLDHVCIPLTYTGKVLLEEEGMEYVE